MPRRSSRPVVLGEFEENREYLLKLCDDAQEHILSLSYRDYMNNTPVKYMAAKAHAHRLLHGKETRAWGACL